MQAVTVKGRFVDEDGNPAQDVVKFVPNQIWVEENGVTYPTLAPEVVLVDGSFEVELSRTDTGAFPWHHTVHSPVGKWTIRIESDGPIFLKNLLPKRFA